MADTAAPVIISKIGHYRQSRARRHREAVFSAFMRTGPSLALRIWGFALQSGGLRAAGRHDRERGVAPNRRASGPRATLVPRLFPAKVRVIPDMTVFFTGYK